MRKVNDIILSAVDDMSRNGLAQDSGQLISASFQFIIGDTDAAGTVKIQASNDILITGDAPTFVPTHWSDIPNATATFLAGAQPALIVVPNMAFRWIRAVFTETTPGATTVICQMMAFSV